jgi:hypothetical protein
MVQTKFQNFHHLESSKINFELNNLDTKVLEFSMSSDFDISRSCSDPFHPKKYDGSNGTSGCILYDLTNYTSEIKKRMCADSSQFMMTYTAFERKSTGASSSVRERRSH